MSKKASQYHHDKNLAKFAKDWPNTSILTPPPPPPLLVPPHPLPSSFIPLTQTSFLLHAPSVLLAQRTRWGSFVGWERESSCFAL